MRVAALQLYLLCGDARSGEIGETVYAISPQAVLIIGQKGTVTLILGVLREIFYANYMHFLCAHFSEAESTFVLILTLFTCLLFRAIRPNPLASLITATTLIMLFSIMMKCSFLRDREKPCFKKQY